METATKTKTTPTIEISKGEMMARLFAVRGTTFIQLRATTELRMNKGRGDGKNRLHEKITKDSITNCIIGFSYENMVNNARGRELSAEVRQACIDAGVPAEILKQYESEVSAMVSDSVSEFVAKPRQWGRHVQTALEFNIETCSFDPVFSRIIIEHEKDGEQRFYVQVAVLNTKTPVYRYADTGEVITDADREYIRQFMPAKKEGERQELKNPIIVRDYRVDNVTGIKIQKTDYSIV